MTDIERVAAVLINIAGARDVDADAALTEMVTALVNTPEGSMALLLLASGAPADLLMTKLRPQILSCLEQTLAMARVASIQARLNEAEAERDKLREQLVEIRSERQIEIGAL